MGIEIARCERLVLHHKFTEAKRSSNACNLVFIDSADHTVDGLGAVFPIGYQFGNHRVVIDRDLHALFKTIIYPNAGAFGGNIGFKRTDIW